MAGVKGWQKITESPRNGRCGSYTLFLSHAPIPPIFPLQFQPSLYLKALKKKEGKKEKKKQNHVLGGFGLGALDWCRPDCFGTVEMTFSALGSKKKKVFKLEICDQNSCRAYNVKRESSREEWSLKVIRHCGFFP